MRRAVFPGSFDPITLGHENIIRRAIPMFDEIVIAIGVNGSKKTMFTLAQRIQMLERVFSNAPSVKVETFSGLTVRFCEKVKADWMLRGVRNGGDFEYERTIAQMTKKLNPSLETIILFTDPEFAPISSTVVRDILANGGDVSNFVPKAVLDFV
ncbi:MAG: pantetheine-phosphate adenylyltransferase [Flavobacteriales bacterium]|nr:pantetheine-phosphate adenylyltransferase [Flavobacteriales bacterium]|tara:strand:+ start:893 stop:1354 length:462 start_codon:yes stop_codon:yes gene_type:complete